MSDAAKPSSRRGHGQGSLQEIEPGLWRLRVLLGRDAVTGRLIQPSRRFRGSKTAAEKELARFRVELDERQHHARSMSPRTTLTTVIEQHLDAAADDRAPGTLRTYRSLLKLHIAPGIGRSPVSKLTAGDLRAYYRQLSNESGLSDSTIWSIYSLISGAISRAQREGGLRFDRNQLVTPKDPARPERRIPTDDELARIFDYAEQLGGDWPLYFRVLAATGMRRGEAAALRWSSLGSDDVLTVGAGIVDDLGGQIEKDPKTHHTRQLLVDATTAQLWRTRQQDVAQEMVEHDLDFSTDLYAFSNDATRRTPRRPDLASKKWKTICQKAKVDEGTEQRSLRNWNITVLREAGFPLEFIGRRVGHEGKGISPLAMTASYTVTRRTEEQRMATALGRRLDRAKRVRRGQLAD